MLVPRLESQLSDKNRQGKKKKSAEINIEFRNNTIK